MIVGPQLPQVDVAPLASLSTRERSPTWRLRFRLRERLAKSLVVVPSLYIVGALVLAEIVPRLDGKHDLLSLRLDADTARTILSAVAGGMIAFTGLVVSIAIVVVQFGASQYTPRLVSRFRRDPVVKHALGLFIAPAIYALRTLRFIGQGHATVVPGITVTLSLLLLVAAVLVFFVLVGRLLDLLRPRRVIAQVVEQGIKAIGDVYPVTQGLTPSRNHAPEGPVQRVIQHNDAAAVLIALDRWRLVHAAAAADVIVEVAAGVGEYLPPGSRLFLIRGDPARVDIRELKRSAILADERTLTQAPGLRYPRDRRHRAPCTLASGQ